MVCDYIEKKRRQKTVFKKLKYAGTNWNRMYVLFFSVRVTIVNCEHSTNKTILL